jgi:hypothetical protein
MGHHVLVVDDVGRRRVVAALFDRRTAAGPSHPERELLLVEVREPRAHGMDQDLAERTR